MRGIEIFAVHRFSRIWFSGVFMCLSVCILGVFFTHTAYLLYYCEHGGGPDGIEA